MIRIAETLRSRGLISAGEKVIHGPGQPSIPFDLAEQAAYSVGVSIRVDGFTLVVMDLKGRVRAQLVRTTPMEDRAQGLEAIKTAIDRQIRASRLDSSRVFGLGVAMSGFFFQGGRSINTANTMDQWVLPDTEAFLSSAFELPVWVENDGNAAAVGENLYGWGRKFSRFAFLYIDYGLGGGVIHNGVLLRGENGNAGEFTGALAPELRADRPTLGLLLQLVRAHGGKFETANDLLEAFSMDLPGVEQWLSRVQGPFSQIISMIAAILDPEAIVLGGRLPYPLTEALAARAQFYSVPVRNAERPFPQVVASELAGDRAAVGAAAIPFANHFFSPDGRPSH